MRKHRRPLVSVFVFFVIIVPLLARTNKLGAYFLNKLSYRVHCLWTTKNFINAKLTEWRKKRVKWHVSLYNLIVKIPISQLTIHHRVTSSTKRYEKTR